METILQKTRVFYWFKQFLRDCQYKYDHLCYLFEVQTLNRRIFRNIFLENWLRVLQKVVHRLKLCLSNMFFLFFKFVFPFLSWTLPLPSLANKISLNKRCKVYTLWLLFTIFINLCLFCKNSLEKCDCAMAKRIN